MATATRKLATLNEATKSQTAKDIAWNNGMSFLGDFSGNPFMFLVATLSEYGQWLPTAATDYTIVAESAVHVASMLKRPSAVIRWYFSKEPTVKLYDEHGALIEQIVWNGWPLSFSSIHIDEDYGVSFHFACGCIRDDYDGEAFDALRDARECSKHWLGEEV